MIVPLEVVANLATCNTSPIVNKVTNYVYENMVAIPLVKLSTFSITHARASL